MRGNDEYEWETDCVLVREGFAMISGFSWLTDSC